MCELRLAVPCACCTLPFVKGRHGTGQLDIQAPQDEQDVLNIPSGIFHVRYCCGSHIYALTR